VYNSLSDLKGNKLWLVTNGWFAPDYSLTDGQNQYGKLYNEGLFSSATILQTENNTITALGAGNGDITLKAAEGKIIGYGETKFFSNTLHLTLNNGLQATLSQPNIWRMIYVWTDANGEKLMEIEGNIHSSLCISFDAPSVQTANFLPLLLAGLKYLINLSMNAN
jgi:hypothetical protein